MGEHTRLRFVIAKDEATAEGFVNALPFKIEIKSIDKATSGKGVTIWFIVPSPQEINSVDLRKRKKKPV